MRFVSAFGQAAAEMAATRILIAGGAGVKGGFFESGLGAFAGSVLKGFVGLQRGGITTGDVAAIVHKNEAVIPLERLPELLAGGSRDEISVQIVSNIRRAVQAPNMGGLR